MKILILGGGLMGPAAAFHAMSNPKVSQVIICDVDQEQLASCVSKLNTIPEAGKLGIVRLDLNNREAAVNLIASFDAVVAALPQSVSRLAVETALQAGTPLVDLAKPDNNDLPALKKMTQSTGGLAILACGLEPGLTEIMARHLAEQLDRVDELHIKCGGIPKTPAPPLGYKIVFGGQQLPLHESDAYIVKNSTLKLVPRYSGVEPVTFSGVGNCEAYHEGFMPWLLDVPSLKNLRVGTQKTVRWPGYAKKISVLKEMGLLSKKPIQVDGADIVPKKLLDTLLYPHVKLEAGEHDIAVFRVEVSGQKEGRPCRLQADMVDWYDDALGFTAMARTTAFTGAVAAQMIAGGDIQARGLLHPEQIITGPLFDQMMAELARQNITFHITRE
jgi:lysine 6-dehydrogenase